MSTMNQYNDNILLLAGLANKDIKPVRVYPKTILLEVNSKIASYTIPGMRVESTTYDVPTYSALKGALDSIYKHKGAEAIPTAVYIHSPIQKTRMPLRNLKKIEGLRSRECLTDVCYTIVVRIVQMNNMRTAAGLEKHYHKFLECASGSCGMGFPFLGIMETPMYFHLVTDDKIRDTQPISKDLGFMPLTSDYTKKNDPNLICRHLSIENGVIDYTKGELIYCYESSKRAC